MKIASASQWAALALFGCASSVTVVASAETNQSRFRADTTAFVGLRGSTPIGGGVSSPVERSRARAGAAGDAAWLVPAGSLGREGGAGDRVATAAVVPEAGEPRGDHGPVGELATAQPMPPARGGGPSRSARATAVPGDQVLRIEDQTENVAVQLPRGCSNISVVGSPAVRELSLELIEPSGARHVGNGERGGRHESLNACVGQTGAYQLRVRMSARPGGIATSQVFVEQRGEPGGRT